MFNFKKLKLQGKAKYNNWWKPVSTTTKGGPIHQVISLDYE
jgi:hypothetical protein